MSGKSLDDRINEAINEAKELDQLCIQRAECQAILRVMTRAASRADEIGVDDYVILVEDHWAGVRHKLDITCKTVTSRLLTRAMQAELKRVEDLMYEILGEESE